jgi:iron complex outermembrane receptor protein
MANQPQKLGKQRTPGTMTTIALGFMVEKLWEHFSIFVNFENFTDTRKTKFDTIYTGTITNLTFRDIYAPVDGFVINGGLNIRL